MAGAEAEHGAVDDAACPQRTDLALDQQQGPPQDRSSGAEKASPVSWPLLLPTEQQHDPTSLRCSGMGMQMKSGSCRPPSSSSIPLLALAGARPSEGPELQEAAEPQASEGGPRAAAASAGQRQQQLGMRPAEPSILPLSLVASISCRCSDLLRT